LAVWFKICCDGFEPLTDSRDIVSFWRLLCEVSIFDILLTAIDRAVRRKTQVHIVMNLYFSHTRTGSHLLLLLSVLWMVGFWSGLMDFIWLFLSLGLVISLVFQIDRFVQNGKNWEQEANVPRPLSLLANALLVLCLAVAVWELFFAIINR